MICSGKVFELLEGGEVAGFDEEFEVVEVKGLVIGRFREGYDDVTHLQVRSNVVFRHQAIGAFGNVDDAFRRC